VNGLDLEEPNWSTGQLTAEESNANKSVTIFPWNCSLTAWHTLHLPGPEILANSLTAPLIVWANSIIGQRHWPTEAGAFLRKLFGSHLSDNSRKSPPIHWTSFLGSLLYRKVWRLVRSKKTLVGLLMDLALARKAGACVLKNSRNSVGNRRMSWSWEKLRQRNAATCVDKLAGCFRG